MLAVLSPARNVRLDSPEGVKPTKPLFPEKTAQIVAELQTRSPWQLESLLDVPPERAFELYDAYANFDSAPAGCALTSYYGAAFRNMVPEAFSRAELDFAQNSLLVLSALYGAARPLDAIRPHRLGLKRDFLVDGQPLYKFWGRDVYDAAFKRGDIVVNLASHDYTKLFSPYLAPRDRHIVCRFLLQRLGQKPRGTVSTVRAARGLIDRKSVV